MYETEEEIDPFENVVVEGIDLQKGQERFEKAYSDILRSWCIHTPVQLEKLRMLAGQLNDEKALDEYTITVHGIKGSTYGICADETAQIAADLEAAARRNDLQFIAANNDSLIEEALLLQKKLEKLLAEITRQGPAKDAAKSPDTALLAQFLEACKQFKSN
jgi:hypothetical protein